MGRDEIYHRNRPSRIKSEVASPSKLVYPIIKQCASCCAAVPQFLSMWIPQGKMIMSMKVMTHEKITTAVSLALISKTVRLFATNIIISGDRIR